VYVISHGRVPTAIAVLAIACGLVGVAMQLWTLSNASSLLAACRTWAWLVQSE
jgi:hypothetical protein